LRKSNIAVDLAHARKVLRYTALEVEHRRLPSRSASSLPTGPIESMIANRPTPMALLKARTAASHGCD
jgi:hypothetical protein